MTFQWMLVAFGFGSMCESFAISGQINIWTLIITVVCLGFALHLTFLSNRRKKVAAIRHDIGK